MECIASKALHRLDFECQKAEKFSFSCGPCTEEGQVSDCEDLIIQIIAAGLSQCLIVDILTDVMWSGLECIAIKGLHRLDFECRRR
eukprot:scaffold91320_cov73-Cyclotella_meneghiniana.AAC.1